MLLTNFVSANQPLGKQARHLHFVNTPSVADWTGHVQRVLVVVGFLLRSDMGDIQPFSQLY